jgi:hypothetical protein
MSVTTYNTIFGTGDVVTYGASAPAYPENNVIDVLGTVMLPKIYGFGLSALEVCSSGKVAYTLNDEHSLDMALSNSTVMLRARDGKSINLGNEGGSAYLQASNGGDVLLSSTGGSNALTMAAGGVRLACAGGSQAFAVSAQQAFSFSVGTEETLRIDGAVATLCNDLRVTGALEVDGPSLVIPRGNTAARPSPARPGMVYYNSEYLRYEGFSSGAWAGLGGVVDVDMNTYVAAEQFPGANDNNVRVVTDGVEAMRVTPSGNVGVGTSTPTHRLEVMNGDAFFGSNVEIGGPSLVIPRGNTAGRPSPARPGMVYYNTEYLRYEGFSSGAWAGLGGVVDVDMNTYVAAEQFPGSNDNNVRVVTNGVEAMRVTPVGNVGVGTSTPTHRFEVAGGDAFFGGRVALSNGAYLDQLTPKNVLLGLGGTGDFDVTDGVDNSGAGMLVMGVPPSVAASAAVGGRFDKSLVWSAGRDGMRALGTYAGYSNEAFWELNGGGFHMSHTNPDTGGKVSFIMRVNDGDQLELVKKERRVNDIFPLYTPLATFGTRKPESVSNDVGFAAVDPVYSFLTTSSSPYTVTARLTTFQAYSEYTVYAALYLAAAQPSSADVMSAVLMGHGYRSATPVSPGVRTTADRLFGAMADGGAIPNAVLKMAVVVSCKGKASQRPFVGYIVNNATFFNNADAVLNNTASGAVPRTSLAFTTTFTQIGFATLSPADKAALSAWVLSSLVATLRAQGVDVSQIQVSLGAGSPAGTAVTVELIVSSAVASSLMEAALAGPLQLLGDPASVTLPSGTYSAATAPSVTNLSSSVVIATPAEPTVSLVVGSDTSISISVSSASGTQSISHVYVLSSATDLGSPTASAVKAGAQADYTPAQLTSPLSLPTSVDTDLYVYVVSQNTYGVLSAVTRFVSSAPQIVLPQGVSLNVSTGLPELMVQTADYSLRLNDGITVNAGAAGGSAYLLLYNDGTPVPSTSAGVMQDVQSGQSNYVSGALLP